MYFIYSSKTKLWAELCNMRRTIIKQHQKYLYKGETITWYIQQLHTGISIITHYIKNKDVSNINSSETE